MNYDKAWLKSIKNKRLLLSIAFTLVIEIWRNLNAMNWVNTDNSLTFASGNYSIDWFVEAILMPVEFALLWFFGVPILLVVIHSKIIPAYKKLSLMSQKWFNEDEKK